jgi:DNA-binding response OmpR family regulator/predicted negative regulator of RcsB-dependent stress response
MVGQGEPMQTALGEALRRHGISVAGCATAELEQAVRVYAPDLVVLIGDAAVRGGASVVRRMAANRATDVLPIAVVSNDAVLKHEGQDFRTGAVAIVPRGAGADTIARRLTELAEEVPERPGLMSGAITESNLQDVVDLVSNDMKTGILSVRSPKGVIEGMPMVVETERASAHNTELILDRLRDAMEESESLEYEFHETSGGRLSTLPTATEPEDVDLGALQGARVVILDSDELRAEKLAYVLSARGVQIAAADFSIAVIPRIREVDPQVVVLDSGAVGGRGIEFVRAMRKDPQLRWASMLVVRWEDFWPNSASGAEPDLARLAGRILPMIDQDAEIARRVEDEVDFDTRLELIGPGRLLRALGSMPGVRHLTIGGHKRSVEIDIADNSIVGAYATLHEGTTQSLQGMPALLALWGLNSGRVSVREQDLPSVANIMMPVDETLGVVSHDLGFADGAGSIEVNAETMPPVQPEVEEHATVPPGASPPAELEAARTMAPPRFRHLQTAVGGEPPQAFPEEEEPTNRVAQLLGRVETQRRPVPATGVVHEHHATDDHTDHAIKREPKATQLGLAPAFEMLAEEDIEEKGTIPVPRKPTPPPPPPPESRKPAPTPMYQGDDNFEPELARMLEGPATLLAPAQTSHGLPAWIHVLLLVTVLAGLGVFGWQLWLRGSLDAEASTETAPEAEAEGAKGPITGPVNGLEAMKREEVERADAPKTEAAEPEATVAEPIVEELAEEPAKPKPAPSPEPSEPEVATPKPKTLAVPTQGLPRDAAQASDVLVHRAVRLIRSGDLRLAEATLDRAWELDPKNPQAMAGYAKLYIAKKEGERAAKWAKKAVRKRSRRAEYHILYGDALQLEGDTDAARKAWRKAMSIEPDNRAARARLAN